ncbi:putative nuclear protein Qri2/Nse4 [Aspergillus heteromorphus CBS 117.55]|uniref:Non-structural maintenance of chromosomes element 4 n=1 Tax=Aspergillus heteromorphus CBS 117.55 TaxID=1448321 RepID=A0A317WWX8_9EURO|nr:putative nuclear protein Qri2/Nse4 [Aspergillus heteromorphus CBS 117.55]PWY90889.1 putative nuclear protein Qri2/Nse4 [Aspergillus heteromorphus CBS 117.55]
MASSSSPRSSGLSDKENRRRSSGVAKRTQTQTMASQSNRKRPRLSARDSNVQASSSQAPPPPRASRDNEYYDPDQDEVERRRIRKGLRDLTRDLNDSRTEFLQAGNHGIRDTIQKANNLFENVKQTSDATIDSRLLVTAADMSYKKTAQLVLGDASAGVDVDEFVSKCISFMRRGPQDPQASFPSSTQRRRTGLARSQQNPNDSDDDDQGDAMNWDWLGRAACFCNNSRPPVPGFLLGPLSVQKRIRQQAARRTRERIDPTKAVAPQDLKDDDLDRQETSNLTTMCASINKLLAKTQNHGQDVVERQLSHLPEDPPEEMVQEVMAKHNVADDGGVPLFQFCINPTSFGQSVENLFYVSFLVRDGMVGISVDSRGLPTLHAAKPHAPSEAQKKGIQKHQAIFTLDFETWRDLTKVYDIKESIIPHREEDTFKMATGSVAVFSPVNLTPEVHETIASLGGTIKYIAALDMEHHLHLKAWKEAFPDAAIIAPEGLWEKRQSNPQTKDASPFEHVFRKDDKDATTTPASRSQSISEEFDAEFETEYVHSHPSRELVFYHRPSRTLIEADLLFNLPAREQYSKTKESATSGILTKMVSPLLSTGSSTTWQKRFVWYVLSSGDRAAFAESVRRIDGWDFNRLIPCHGDVVESGAKGVYRSVMEWLLADRKHV